MSAAPTAYRRPNRDEPSAGRKCGDLAPRTHAGLRLLIAKSDLTNYWTDADGSTVTLTGINLVTTNHVNLITNGTYIIYTNSPNVNDQFSYGISDGQGGTNTGVINVVVNPFVRAERRCLHREQLCHPEILWDSDLQLCDATVNKPGELGEHRDQHRARWRDSCDGHVRRFGRCAIVGLLPAGLGAIGGSPLRYLAENVN